MQRVTDFSIQQLATLIQSRELSPVEIVSATLDRIASIDPRLNSYITVGGEAALGAARAAEEDIAKGAYLGPLHGIPIGIKDVIETADLRTTGGSRVLEDWVPSKDAACVHHLRRSGAIIIGKHNTHEFALGVTNKNEAFGLCRNPWSPDCIPGGSSGGSAAAVAAALCYGAVGTDTGSSVRRPAAFCGVVGLKPTLGLVDREGVLLISWTFDHVGPLARTVGDAGILLRAIAGAGSAKRFQIEPGTARSEAARASPASFRVGVPKDWIDGVCAPKIRNEFQSALRVLSGIGATIIEIVLPYRDEILPALRLVVAAETAVLHEGWLATRKDRYSDEARAKVQVGRFIPAPLYLRALQLREIFQGALSRSFRSVDVIATPTMPLIAPTILPEEGEQTVGSADFDLAGVYCAIGSMGGLPSVSVPMGLVDCLPSGLLLTGKPWAEDKLLSWAEAFEQSAGHVGARPPDTALR